MATNSTLFATVLRTSTLFLLCLVLGQICCRSAEDGALSARVIVLANRDDSESLELARYYMEKRQVPEANLLALPMPKDETITWPQFVASIYQPAQDELLKQGWIQAIETSLTDKIGRRRNAISTHRIAYLVVCKGVPLRIAHDPALYEPAPPYTNNPQLRTNWGAVDAELSLLVRSGYAINGLVPNPLYRKEHPSFIEEALVVKVSRLDGPTYASAAALVDNALKAEQQGLIGRSYVDLGGPYPEGEKWMESVVRQLGALGFDGDVDRKPAIFPATARFDAPVLYFGWHTSTLAGPFAQPGFHFPAGAIAVHIHSFSAQTLRSSESGWCGPLVAKGVTATVGNVYEPYLPFTHHLDLLMRALAEGRNFGDAVLFSLPALSWQAVALGDPLYRPFAVPLSEQWRRRHEIPEDLFPYIVLRESRRLENAGRPDQARAIVIEALQEKPGLVLALRAAELLKASGDVVGARRAFEAILPLKTIPLSLAPVATQAAQFCSESGDPKQAVQIFRTLIGLEGLSVEQRLALLPPAIKAAEAAGDPDILGPWSQMLEAIRAKPPNPPKP